MYERFIGAIEDAAALAVMRLLRDASQQRHLPAFQQCVARAERGGGAAAGLRGHGRGHGARERQ